LLSQCFTTNEWFPFSLPFMWLDSFPPPPFCHGPSKLWCSPPSRRWASPHRAHPGVGPSAPRPDHLFGGADAEPCCGGPSSDTLQTAIQMVSGRLSHRATHGQVKWSEHKGSKAMEEQHLYLAEVAEVLDHLTASLHHVFNTLEMMVPTYLHCTWRRILSFGR